MNQSKYQTQSRNIEVDRKKPGMNIDGRYLLIEKIGTGSFGEVWRAKYLGLRGRSSEIVAIKFMHSACATTESRERFSREIYSLQLLHGNPNVVEIIETGCFDDKPYMVMEYVNGTSLRERITLQKQNGQSFSLTQVRSWFVQICRAVAQAHHMPNVGPILHRDLTPNNIMLKESSSDDCDLKVLDFGIAHLAQHPFTLTGQRVGTPGYMSPEQSAGDSRFLTTASDVFSLGILLVEMLTLSRFSPSGELLANFAVQYPDRLRDCLQKMRSDVPDSLWDTVVCALSLQANNRYQNVNDFSAAVSAAIDSEIVDSCPEILPSSNSGRISLPGHSGVRLATLSWVMCAFVISLSIATLIWLIYDDSERFAMDITSDRFMTALIISGVVALSGACVLALGIYSLWMLQRNTMAGRALLRLHQHELFGQCALVRSLLVSWCKNPEPEAAQNLLTNYARLEDGSVILDQDEVELLERQSQHLSSRAVRVGKILAAPKCTQLAERLRHLLLR
jgi:serine/threonine protein kinase